MIHGLEHISQSPNDLQCWKDLHFVSIFISCNMQWGRILFLQFLTCFNILQTLIKCFLFIALYILFKLYFREVFYRHRRVLRDSLSM